MTKLIVLALLQTFGLISIGWISRFFGYIKSDEIPRYSEFIIDILFPILIFHSIVSSLRPCQLSQLWVLPFIGFGTVAFGGLVGILLKKGTTNKDTDMRNTFHHFCAINNYGLLPILIVSELFGNSAIAELFLFNLGMDIGFWTIGVSTLSGKLNKNIKGLFSSNIVAILLALVIVVTGISRYIPPTFFEITALSSAATVPLMLIIIGAGMYPFPNLIQKKDLAYLTLVRLILIPSALISIIYFLPINNDLKSIPYIVAIMPAPMGSAILTHIYGGNAEFANRGAIVTTIVSIITIPLSILLLTQIGIL